MYPGQKALFLLQTSAANIVFVYALDNITFRGHSQ